MNLRNVSIWCSSVVLLGITGFLAYITAAGGVVNMVFGTIAFLLFCGFPPVVSIMLSMGSKNPLPHIILTTASLLYGGWFAYVVYNAFFVHLDPQSGIAVLLVGIFSLPVMVPLWILAPCLDLYLTKKYAPKPHVVIRINDAPDPETAASTPSSPTLFDGGQQTQ